MAIVITSILLVGMGSALTMTISGAQAGIDKNARASAADEAMTRIAAELATATVWRQRTAALLEFEVPDRNGDGNAEVIMYSWASKPGAPLLRSYNGAEAICVADVYAMDLSVLVRTAPVEIESTEQTHKECENPSFATRTSDIIDAGLSAAQYLRPTLPANAASWKISRVSLMMARSGGVSGNLRVSIQTADAARKPTGTVLASAVISEASLPATADWVTVPLTAASIAPTSGVCIVIESVAGALAVGAITKASGSSAQPLNSHYTKQLGTGAAWSTPDDNVDMRFIAYGTYTTLQEGN